MWRGSWRECRTFCVSRLRASVTVAWVSRSRLSQSRPVGRVGGGLMLSQAADPGAGRGVGAGGGVLLNGNERLGEHARGAGVVPRRPSPDLVLINADEILSLACCSPRSSICFPRPG